jgi:hypothetical protein
MIMSTVPTLRPATPEEVAAWRAGNDAGRGYAPDTDIDTAYVDWMRLDNLAGKGAGSFDFVGQGRRSQNFYAGVEILVTEDGKTAIGDANGPWAVDIEPQAE